MAGFLALLDEQRAAIRDDRYWLDRISEVDVQAAALMMEWIAREEAAETGIDPRAVLERFRPESHLRGVRPEVGQ